MIDKRGLIIIDLDTDFNNSIKRIEELRAERLEEDIPLGDEYWKALRKHRDAYMKGNYGK